MNMEPIGGSETSAIRTKTLGNYPKETYDSLLQVHSLQALFDAVNLYTFDMILVCSQPKDDKPKIRILIKRWRQFLLFLWQ